MAKNMRPWKLLAWAACLGLVITGAAAQDKAPVQDQAPPKDDAAAAAVPLWAFPGPFNKSVPGSKQAYSDVQMFDRTSAVDWFPDKHPSMPAAVRGRLPVYACGYCHLPEGAGRPENAALAGMPYDYLKQQVDDMRSGARTLVDSHFGPGANMMLTITHKQLSKADAYAAVKYYSELKYTKHTKIIETNEIPRVTTNSFVYVFDKSAAREPLGERIVEGPDDFERFEMRDPNMTFTAYVPVGAIARGAALAKGDSARAACETCHGPGLKGSQIGPPIAGRPLTPLFRQMYAFKTGTRNGATSVLMKPIMAGLSYKDMIDLSAYVGSLEP
jgi:cytochrome c553